MRTIAKILGAGLAAASLTACAGQADFGRTKPNEMTFLNELNNELGLFGDPSQTEAILPMTAEEEQLRILAENILVQTTPERGFLERLGVRQPVDRSDKSYYERLRRTHADSGVSLLNNFGNDVMRDITMVDQISSVSIDVTAADAQRLSLVSDAMADNNAAFSDAVDVVLRVEDNGRVIDQTVDLMTRRLGEYHVALEQASFDVPERDLLATIGKALELLEESVAGVVDDAARHRAIRGELFARRSADLPV